MIAELSDSREGSSKGEEQPHRMPDVFTYIECLILNKQSNVIFIGIFLHNMLNINHFYLTKNAPQKINKSDENIFNLSLPQLHKSTHLMQCMTSQVVREKKQNLVTKVECFTSNKIY